MNTRPLAQERLRPSVAAAIIGLVALVAFWSLFTFVVISQRVQEEERTLAEGNRLISAIEAYAAGLFTELERSMALVSGVTDNEATHDWLRDQQYLNLLGRIARDNTIGADILVLDRFGVPVNLEPDRVPESLDFAYYSGFSEHQNSDSLSSVVRPVTVNPVNGEPMIPVTRRLELADGAFAGVLVMGLNTARMTSIFDAVRFGNPGAVILMREDGMVLMREPPDPNLTGRMLPNSAVIRAVSEGQKDGSLIANDSAEYPDRLLIYRSLGDLPLLVTIAKSEQEIFANWWRSVRALVLGSVLLTLAMILLTALLVSQLIRGERNSEALQRAIEDAEAANKAKSEFLARISHELRTPLNAINGFAEMIEHETLGANAGPEYREYAKLIRQSGTHLLSLVNDVLDLSRVEAGRRILEREAVSARDTVDFCIKMMQADAAEKGLAMIKILPDQDPPLESDRLALRQILLNLVSNAVKYTPPKGRVTVKVGQTDRHVMFTVTDTGVGMDLNTLKSTQEAFGGASAWIRPQGQGTGLGLPISRSLTELMGGQMSIETNLGRGTAVTLTFPLAGSSPNQTKRSEAA